MRVVVQPVVDLATGGTVGAEALARFPGFSGLPVSERFAAAYAAGHGSELEAACLRAALQRRGDMPHGTWLAVNVSPDALAQPVVQQALVGPLDGVVVELTEVCASDPDLIKKLVIQLRERGALIAVDDASTGYAGLLRLSMLRPDFVKLDADLVTGVADSVEQSAVIEALVSLSRRIGARVIGEGVERLDDLRALVDLDVDYGQGWALAHPAENLGAVSPDAVETCLAARRSLMHRQATAPAAHFDLHHVTAALAGTVEAGELSLGLRRAAATLGVDAIGLSILAGGELHEIATAEKVPDRAVYPLGRYPATQKAMRNGQMLEIHVDDPNSDPAERTLLKSLGFASLLLVPMLRHGVPLGILELSHQTRRRWTSHDIRQAHTLADHLTHALLRLTDRSAPG